MRRVLALAIFVAAAVCATVPADSLAAPIWKLNGSAVTENVSVKTEATEMQLEDTKGDLGGPAIVECLISTEGTVGTEGKGKISEAKASSCTPRKRYTYHGIPNWWNPIKCCGTISPAAALVPQDGRSNA
jgi:hypothetical protein